MLLNSTFNFLGSCNFKWLRKKEGLLRNIHGTFKQTGLRYSSRQLCHCIMAGSSVARRQYMSWSCRPCHPAIAVLSTGCRPLGSCSRAAGWSAATSCFVQFFGRRHEEAIHALRRPASEKRQCTKSRECGTPGSAASAMGIVCWWRSRW